MPHDRQADVEQIQSILMEYPGIRLALLFGSMAKEKAGAASDLDLAVEMDENLDAPTAMSLIEKLACATGRPVDLVDLRVAGEPLLGQILHHGKRLIGSPERYAMLINRHLLNEADFMPLYRRILDERRKAWIGN